MRMRALTLAAAAASLSAAPAMAHAECDDDVALLEREEQEVYRIDAYDRRDEFRCNFYMPRIRDERTYALPGRGKHRATGARAIQRKSKKQRRRSKRH